MDLKEVNVSDKEWYDVARRSRSRWRALCRLGMEEMMETQQPMNRQSASLREVACEACGRRFRRESDKKRHKCIEERRKPVREQRGAVQCVTCMKWFLSRGRLAVHTCRPPES